MVEPSSHFVTQASIQMLQSFTTNEVTQAKCLTGGKSYRIYTNCFEQSFVVVVFEEVPSPPGIPGSPPRGLVAL